MWRSVARWRSTTSFPTPQTAAARRTSRSTCRRCGAGCSRRSGSPAAFDSCSGSADAATPRPRPRSAELDALGQGEIVGVVDGVGRPAHVGLPRVAAALAPAAGGLLAAEGTADLGAAGTDVDVGDAAVAAVGGAEPLGLAHVGGEDAAGQALRHAVLQMPTPRRSRRMPARRARVRTSRWRRCRSAPAS